MILLSLNLVNLNLMTDFVSPDFNFLLIILTKSKL